MKWVCVLRGCLQIALILARNRSLPVCHRASGEGFCFSALHLEFIPHGNNEKGLGGWGKGPSLPW